MNAIGNKTGNKITLGEEAYNIFKEGILSGEIAKGEIFTQAFLAKKFNVAISPLRVATTKLESEGLIKVMSRSGIQIINTDFELTRNTYQLRVILEREGLRTYIRSVSEQEIDYFRQQHELLKTEIIDSQDRLYAYKTLAKLDSELHTKFVLALDNKIITKSYLANEELIRLTRLDRVDLASQEMMISTVNEHLALIDAIGNRDQKKALATLDKHLETSIKRAMGLWGF
ncbi:GntR family transcriptional regulator [Shewanella sp. 10N.7]|uniref:GntR family transcriptional regulator n=1 Tax=Shewanella sp. 10N.7 TaxID=2885093 RepID=UPI001E4F0BD1|nr:GntR family transcriptional regulator [Shewanella sp. 10N.7]MCC4834263.1 GntR family transcriptional regulator [Shewanella sp. 10N.7]